MHMISAAVTAAVLSSAAVSMASTTLFSDDFSDGNPLTIGGVPVWTAGSDENLRNPGAIPNSAMTQSGDLHTISNPPSTSTGSLIQEPGGSSGLKLSATFDNDLDPNNNTKQTNNLGPTLQTTTPSSAFNFFNHPVQITLKAPAGGNLMPLFYKDNGPAETDFTPNEAFLYFELNPAGGASSKLPATATSETYFRISNPQNANDPQAATANQVVTQYVWRSTNPALNNATPAFTTPRPIDPTGRITSVTLFLDGSRYDPSKGAGGQDAGGVPLPNNSTPLMFNWGVTDVDSNGVTHTYWLWSSGVTQNGSGAQAADGARADSNFGSGNYGGSGEEGVNLQNVYNAWSQNGTIARNDITGNLGIELLRQIAGLDQPSSVTLGSISVIDPRSPGDVNYDGVVDTRDFVVLASNFNGTGPTNTSDNSVNGKIWYQGDMNGDGLVNALDFNILATNFGTNYNSPAPGALVPEPATIAGLALAALGFTRRRRG